DRIPKSWAIECMNDDIEYIFVPSEHTKNAIINTMRENLLGAWVGESKVKVIPHGVNLDLFYPKEKPKDKFTFLCNKGWRHLEDRGGIQYAVKAYMEEFTQVDNVNLIIKINPAYGIPDVNKLVSELVPKDKKDFASIQINADNINYDKLVDLYNKAHVLVAPSRADAFNIPVAEALACEVMPIISNFQGASDFVDNEVGLIIGGELKEVQHELLYEGVKWLDVSIPELRKAMRWCYNNQDKVKEKALLGKERIKDWTWDHTVQKIRNLI
ncbi:MAG: glycosyltransferase family 4 protein, partial [Nanoarchaeota archaeon]